MTSTTSPLPPALPRPPSAWCAKLGLLFGTWTIVALFFASRQLLFLERAKPWWVMPAMALAEWYLWALFTPIIFFVARRNIVTRDNWLRLAPRLIGGWLLIASVYLVCFIALVALILAAKGDQRMGNEELFSVQFRGNLHQCVLTCLLITLAAYVIEYYRRLNASERAAAEMKAQLAAAQLQALKMQLHPHFLFNTLHAISALIHKDAQLADRMIARLSEFLRLTLENSGAQEVPLRQELDFLNRYLAIEKLRFQERLSLLFDIAPETLDALTPNLILQPLVENAMRHGIAASEYGGQLEITARRTGEQLH